MNWNFSLDDRWEEKERQVDKEGKGDAWETKGMGEEKRHEREEG